MNCRDKKSYSRSHISEVRNHLSKIRLQKSYFSSQKIFLLCKEHLQKHPVMLFENLYGQWCRQQTILQSKPFQTPTADNKQPPTDNKQPTTDNKQPTTDNRPWPSNNGFQQMKIFPQIIVKL